MDIIIGVLIVISVGAFSLAVYGLRRASQAEALALRALSKISDIALEDKVLILPDGQVRVAGLRSGGYFQVVFLGEPNRADSP